MIKLENVSTERLIMFLGYGVGSSQEMADAYLALTRHCIRDFRTLKNMVGNGRKEFNNEILKSAIEEVEKNIAHANSLGREPIVFTCDNYINSTVFSKTLKYTDKHNNCDVLICKNPTIAVNGKYGLIKDITVSEAKDLLTKVVGHDKQSAGNNAFLEKFKRFTVTDVKNVRDAINFYEKQVLRQAAETKRRGINLFTINKEKKEFMVRDDIKNIAKYILDNADVCVWGELSNAQKSKILTAVTRYSGYENQVIREKIIEIIANYTTLSELESGVVKQKTLDRFIIK